MPDPRLSIIIPTYGRWESLERLLLALQLQTIREDLEIMVIDQNNEGYLEFNLSDNAKKGIEFIQGVRPNVCLARNVGYKVSKANFLLFIDDDLLPGNDFCEKGLSLMIKNELEILAPLIYGVEGEEYAIQSMSRKSVSKSSDVIIQVDDVISAAFFITRSTFKKIGGFDVNLFDLVRSVEDKDFFNRANHMGLDVNVDLSNLIFHEESVEGGCDLRRSEYWALRKRFMKGWVYMALKASNGRLLISDYWSFYRSAILNRKAVKSGVKYIFKSLRVLNQAIWEMKESWKPEWGRSNYL